MNYDETLKYLYDRLPMFQRIGAAAYKADLIRTIRLVNLFGNPHEHLRFIHIAGTNGKGSVSHMLASILQSKGLKTGLYTSPHMKDFRERIRVDGKMVPKNWVSKFVSYFRKDFEPLEPSFFELTFAMAMRYFKEEGAEIVVLETGMGGRLDSTNIVHPLVSVITNISMDHKEFLGGTGEMIAAEKAGIIKPNVPVVIGKKQTVSEEIFRYKAEMEDAPIIFAEEMFEVRGYDFAGAQRGKLVMDIFRNGFPYITGLRSPLTGLYQLENIVTVLQACQELIRMGYDIRKNHIIKGINDVVKQTGLMGRYQVLGRQPLIICDTGHNQDGVRMVMQQLISESFDKLHIVLGVVGDKDLKEVLKLLPSEATYYFCKADIPRGLDVDILRQLGYSAGLIGKGYPSVRSAYEAALLAASENDLIFIGGSTFTVAEVL
jgi:dihydrofolate synthase / folylpolyglutamate synthase